MIVRGERSLTALRMAPTEDRSLPALPTMAQVLQARRDEVAQWMKFAPPAPERYAQAVQTAWLIFWLCQIGPEAGYSRQTILSSRMTMAQIWSWDNCFNALAVARTDARLAWDQLFVILDKQAPSGVLPDVVNDLQAIFGYNKPPIYGWTIHRLLAMTPPAERKAYVQEANPKLVNFHEWWFKYRDLAGDGVPLYMHGNDSGWDNSTIFDEGYPVQSPDLLAHLILDAEGLAEMAKLLGRQAEAARWTAEAKQKLALFHATFARNGELIYRVLTPQGVEERHSTSLLTRIPVILGQRLAPEVRARLAAELGDESSYLSAFGPASESLSSAKYMPNGYWRGPVWGPSTYLIFSGIAECGETKLAKTIADRFCALCARTANFSENYNAKTGADQYDSGMPWTASDFLMMAEWLHAMENAKA